MALLRNDEKSERVSKTHAGTTIRPTSFLGDLHAGDTCEIIGWRAESGTELAQGGVPG